MSIADLAGMRPGSFENPFLPLLQAIPRTVGLPVRGRRLSGDARQKTRAEARIVACSLLTVIAAVVLAAPVALMAALRGLMDLPEPFLFPLNFVVVVVDFYLAARMSLLFSHAASNGNFPPRDMWQLSNGAIWKLCVGLLLAPWPFNVAFALLEGLSANLQAYLQIPVFVLAGALSLGAIAVMASILYEGFRICPQWKDGESA